MIKLGHFKSFMVCFAPLSAVFLSVVGFLAWESSSVREKAIADDQRFALEKSVSVLRERIDVVISDLLILSESQQLDAILAGQGNYEQLASEYALFSMRRGVYDQIRYLDSSGQEVVRVNYGSGIPFAVPPRELQNKAERPYFRQIQKASRGTVYISGIGLNEEFGEIEKPIKPVIRLSAPVFDKFGERQGAIVLNLRAAPILNDVVAMLALDGAQPFVLDDTGGWILGGQEGENWSEDLTGTPAVIADRYPQAWETMQQGMEKFRNDDGLFSVRYLEVSDLLLSRASTRSLSVIFGDEEAKNNRLALYVGARLPNNVLEGLLWPERGTLIIVSAAFLLLIAIGSAAYAWTRQRQLTASFDAKLSEQVLRASKNSVVVADQSGTILKVNPGFTAMTGYLPNEAVGKPLSFIRAERESNEQQLDDILMAARTNGTWEGEVRNRRKSGDFFYSNMVVSAIVDPSTDDVSFVEMGLDISRHMENAQELWRQANHDALTGLPNRLLFEDRLEVACGHAENEGHSIALIYIDLDGFKPINDRHGHEVGDHVLRTVGERIKSTIRQGDTVARLGGDEFAVIADDVKGREEAEWVAQKVAASIQRVIHVNGLGVSVGASVGIAIFPQDSRDMVALVGMADDKMYQQKRIKKSSESSAVIAE